MSSTRIERRRRGRLPKATKDTIFETTKNDSQKRKERVNFATVRTNIFLKKKKKKKKKEIRRNTLLGKIQAIHSFVKSRGRKVRRRTNVELAVNRVQF